MKKLIGLLFYILLLSPSIMASHIVGGEFNYRQLANYNYELRLTLIRDCINGIPPFDSPASIQIRNNNYIQVSPYNFNMRYRGSTLVPHTFPAPCIVPDYDVCYEITTYIDTLYLPPISGGYQFTYDRCCRNGTLINIRIPSRTEATYYASVPDTSKANSNSNPEFNAWMPTYVCVATELSFDHSATDLDGDSLVYELYQPFRDNYDPTLQPPISRVNWRSPYSTTDMTGSNPPLKIDSATGLLKVTINQLGQFLVGVKVSEYRNGIFLSATYRDYQLNVTPCGIATTSSFISPSFNCESNNSDFENKSYGRISGYLWDFGDNTISTDTSTSKDPSYKYTDTGAYKVSLITYSSVKPDCNDTTFAIVTVHPDYKHNISYFNDPCTKEVIFNAKTSLDSVSTIKYKWDFGDSNGISYERNPTYLFDGIGEFMVSLISNSSVIKGCNDTSEVTVNIYPEFELNSSINEIPCISQINYSAYTNFDSLFPIKYLWDFGESQFDSDTSDQANGIFEYQSSGLYNANLIVSLDSSICTDTAEFLLNVYPNFLWNYSIKEDSCSFEVAFQASSTYDLFEETSYIWAFGDGEFSDKASIIYEYLDVGSYPVRLEINTSSGCVDSVLVDLLKEGLLEIFIPNVFTPNDDAVNDILYVKGDMTDMDLKVYNRWGRKVFESKNKNMGWDGKFEGKFAEEGVYFYHLVTKCSDNSDQLKKGTITLIR